MLVLERDTVGSGASGAAAGMLAPTAEVQFEELELLSMGRESLAMWPEFRDELEAASGMDIDYDSTGTLVIGLDRDDLEAIEHLWSYHRELGLEVERLDGDEARELEPGLVPGAHGALRIAGDHKVDPAQVVRALAKAATQAGATLREKSEATEIIYNGGRVKGVLVGEDVVEANAVIVAAGAWSRAIKGLEDLPHVRPVKGQMISLELGTPAVCNHVIRAPDAYLVPHKRGGQLVVGATMEEMGWDDRLTAGGVFELLRGAWETLPAIYDLPIVDMWTGFRPITLNNLPHMGRSTHRDGLFYSVGHGRNGILLTPLTASRVASMVRASL